MGDLTLSMLASKWARKPNRKRNRERRPDPPIDRKREMEAARELREMFDACWASGLRAQREAGVREWW